MTTAYQEITTVAPATEPEVKPSPRYEELPAWERRIYGAVWAAEGRVLSVPAEGGSS